MTLDLIQIGTLIFVPTTKEIRDGRGNPIALRNQSSEVLSYLVTHAGKLVTKDELIQNVWPETHVTDDSLVQCIGDIRRALGDESRKILQTVPKKGYRLMAAEGVDAIPTPNPSVRRRWAVAMASASLLIAGFVAFWIQVLAPRQHTSLQGKPRIAVLAFDDFSTGEDIGI